MPLLLQLERIDRQDLTSSFSDVDEADFLEATEVVLDAAFATPLTLGRGLTGLIPVGFEIVGFLPFIALGDDTLGFSFY